VISEPIICTVPQYRFHWVPSSELLTHILPEEKLPFNIVNPVVTLPKLLLWTDWILPPESTFPQKDIVKISPWVQGMFYAKPPQVALLCLTVKF